MARKSFEICEKNDAHALDNMGQNAHSSTMTAIVTCGYTRPALAATRSLGRAQIPVAVAMPFRPALAAWSRFATSTFLVPDPHLDARRFARVISKSLQQRYATCAITSTNAALWALSRWRDELPLMAQRIFPPHLSVVRSLDLSALHDLAESVRVPCIDTVRMNPGDPTESVLKNLSGLKPPFLVRPLVPWTEREDGSRRIIENRVVYTLEELRVLLEHHYEVTAGGCLVESRPEGRSIAYVAVCKQGKPFAELFQERLHEARPFSEVATLARTITPIPRAKRLARTILDALSWQGPAKVEMVETPSGEIKLVTVIGRLWGSAQLAINAGVNVPLLCYRLAEDSAQISKTLIKGQPGIQMRWMRGDIKPLVLNTFRKTKQLFGTNQASDNLSNASPAQINKRYWDVLDLADPMPFFFEVQHATRQIVRKNPMEVFSSL